MQGAHSSKRDPQGSHPQESFPGLKGPLRAGRVRSPWELWLFPGLPAIHEESPFLWVLQGSPSPLEKPHLSIAVIHPLLLD